MMMDEKNVATASFISFDCCGLHSRDRFNKELLGFEFWGEESVTYTHASVVLLCPAMCVFTCGWVQLMCLDC